MNEKYEILNIKLGNFLTICLTISFKKLEDNTYVLKNEKMNYEYYSEEKDKNIAKEDFAKAILVFLISGIKEKKIFKWLNNWGFEEKENDKSAFESALKDVKKKINQQKKDFFIDNNIDNLDIKKLNYNWDSKNNNLINSSNLSIQPNYN